MFIIIHGMRSDRPGERVDEKMCRWPFLGFEQR